MTKREKFILQMALSYLYSNIDDACDACIYDGPGCLPNKVLVVNGNLGHKPTEDEVKHLLSTLDNHC